MYLSISKKKLAMLGKLTIKTNASYREETMNLQFPKYLPNLDYGNHALWITKQLTTVLYRIRSKNSYQIFSTKIHHRFTNQSFNGWKGPDGIMTKMGNKFEEVRGNGGDGKRLDWIKWNHGG